MSDSNAVVDEDNLLMLQEVMEDEFKNLLETYLEDSKLRLAELSDKLSSGDADAAYKTAHSLKGSSSNIGAGPLAELCRQVEQQARGGDLGGLLEKFQEIEVAFDAVSVRLTKFL